MRRLFSPYWDSPLTERPPGHLDPNTIWNNEPATSLLKDTLDETLPKRFPTTFDAMAFDGQCRETLQYMADCYRKLSSGRDSIEGERKGTILLGKTEFISYICSIKKYRTVIAYKDYFENFLRAQKPKVQSKILQILRLIEEMEVVPKNHLKHITGTNGLFELRVIFRGDIFRVFCFFDAGKLVVLLSGFQKKTQNTPKNEIEKAVRLMNDYYREKAAEE